MRLNLKQIQIFKRKWWLTKGQVMCLATVVRTEKKSQLFIEWMNKATECFTLNLQSNWHCFVVEIIIISVLQNQWELGLTELLICFKCLMYIITSLISTVAIWVRFYYSHFKQAQSLSNLSRTQIITDGTWFKSEQLKRLAVVLEGVQASTNTASYRFFTETR